MIALILSDVIGDPLPFIASGPTVPNETEPSGSSDVLNTLSILDRIPLSILNVLENQTHCGKQFTEYDLGVNGGYRHVENVIVGSNRIFLSEAQQVAIELHYVPFILTHQLAGYANLAGEVLATLAVRLCKVLQTHAQDDACKADFVYFTQTEFEALDVTEISYDGLFTAVHQSVTTNKPLCVLSAGETVVNVQGNGTGGRNRELALSAALHWHKTCDNDLMEQFNVQLLSMATDGQDGPSLGGASGASVDFHTVCKAIGENLDVQSYLINNDSGTFFDALDNSANSVWTGLTGTNVMDVQVLMIAQHT